MELKRASLSSFQHRPIYYERTPTARYTPIGMNRPTSIDLAAPTSPAGGTGTRTTAVRDRKTRRTPRSRRAFTSVHAAEHAKLTQRDIVILGFELEHDGHMPTTLLDACSANTDIWWSRRTTRRMELKRAVQPQRARKNTESSEQKTKRARNSS